MLKLMTLLLVSETVVVLIVGLTVFHNRATTSEMMAVRETPPAVAATIAVQETSPAAAATMAAQETPPAVAATIAVQETSTVATATMAVQETPPAAAVTMAVQETPPAVAATMAAQETPLAAAMALQETSLPVSADDIKLTAAPNASHSETTTSSPPTAAAHLKTVPQRVDVDKASTPLPAEKPAAKRARVRALVASTRVAPHPSSRSWPPLRHLRPSFNAEPAPFSWPMIRSSSTGSLNSLHWPHAMRSPRYNFDMSSPQLWDGRSPAASSDRRVRGPDTQGRKAGRSAGSRRI
jgi:hypothetical protein